jgi:nicotinamidase-related amidase
MARALLVIDMQRALCTGEEAAHDAEALIGRVNALMAKARAADVPIVLVQHEEATGSLVHGSDGWQLADGLGADGSDLRLRKTTPDSFLRTGLDAMLRERGVTDVVVCGLQSDFCIDSTVRGALARGYGVTLVADGHSTVDNPVLSAPQITRHHNRTLACIGSFGPRVDVVPAAAVALALA